MGGLGAKGRRGLIQQLNPLGGQPLGPSQMAIGIVWAVAVMATSGCVGAPTSSNRTVTVTDSLGADRHPIRMGPFSRGQADSAFAAVVTSLSAALGDPSVCGQGTDVWPSKLGSLWLFQRGPDAIPRDTAGWSKRPQWGLVLAFDSTDHVGCRRGA